MQDNPTQYTTTQYNTTQCNAMHYTTIQYTAILYNTLEYDATLQCNIIILHGARQYYTGGYNTTLHNILTIQYITTQHNTTQ